ncbi:DEAD-box RNA helicase PRP5 SCDLUD_001023 [Saccharomycodes ludwigii]|uniref:DEAD-box RNA helicase PRP5 n=1 Tax=Saccharomycodes ludwigii TaxID=36035 RepID=UPI001E81CF98|nr:hypothetical protein SCDLUD_001023 [Saccharomycodes ludwigii]KAH3903389.1 hypothetical protein SCDLUD_001023 [Saccharomycodes ludwigii]
MSNNIEVSEHTLAKEENARKKLLEERRKRLSKWKLRKQQNDAAKQMQSTTSTNVQVENTNKLNTSNNSLTDAGGYSANINKNNNTDSKSSGRFSQKLSSGSTTAPSKESTKKKGKKLTFEQADEDTEEGTNPTNIKENTIMDLTYGVTNGTRDNTDNSNDPLDVFMDDLNKNIEAEEKKMNSRKRRSSFDQFIPNFNDEAGLLSDDSYSIALPVDNEGEDSNSELKLKQKQRKKKRKSKRIKRLNTNFSDLIPFTKNFYMEPEELGKLSDEEVSNLRFSLDNIQVHGSGVIPKPIVKWSHLGLSSEIMDTIINKLKFIQPTPIQAQAIPCIMSGRDVLGVSKTGSGKTISFLLPLLRQIEQQPPLLPPLETGPLGLILSPTRELAAQIFEEAQIFLEHSVSTRGGNKIRCLNCTGGTELKDQIKQIKRGVEIIVATPGRFIDLCTLNSGKLLRTDRITMVILDEADRLFDMGFGPQVKNIMRGIRKDRQCVLFSATFPESLKNFTRMFLNDPISITISSKDLINENIEQRCTVVADEFEKFHVLRNVLLESYDSTTINEDVNNGKKIIIFVVSQDNCDLLYNNLKNPKRNFPQILPKSLTDNIYAIHAGKQSTERQLNLMKFKKPGEFSVLICTEILSRGLNVPEVGLVVIYDAVKAFPQYVHTTGRTARSADKRGVAHTFLLNNECDIRASYILQKSMRETELAQMEPEHLKNLNSMADEFSVGLKNGKYRLLEGFGGKGLEHMEELFKRNKSGYLGGNDTLLLLSDNDEDEDDPELEQQRLEYEITKVYEEEQNPNHVTVVASSNAHANVLNDNKMNNNVISYRAKVQINDLPQLARWEMTKNETLLEIKRETGCSITTKGRFYKTSESLLKKNKVVDEPRLYLLLENKVKDDLELAIQILQDKLHKGLIKHETQETHKFGL